mgnify:CR=1 FL=1
MLFVSINVDLNLGCKSYFILYQILHVCMSCVSELLILINISYCSVFLRQFCVTVTGFSEQLLKGVFKCMTLSLGQYTTSKSRNAAVGFVKDAAYKYPSSVAKHFVEGTKDFCEKQSQYP